jgi:hypothetical protein
VKWITTALTALKRWQEPVVWLPLLIVLLVIAYQVLPQIDPRAGIDGFGALWASGVTAFNAVLAGFLTWFLRQLYTLELTDADERELIDHAAGIDRDGTGKRAGAGPATTQALGILALDRAVWLAIFLPVFYALQG